MACKENFLSDLGQVSGETPIGFFCLRGIFPFSAGAIYDNDFFKDAPVDWFPIDVESFSPEMLEASGVGDFILPIGSNDKKVLDTGEQLVIYSLSKGKKPLAHISRADLLTTSQIILSPTCQMD